MLTPFRPSAIPPKDLDWSALVSHVGQAHAAVARYDGRLEAIPNPRVFLSPLLTQEAVLSSKIEGTQATLEEVLEFEADPSSQHERTEDIKEIINYRRALSHAEHRLDERPLTLNLIREMHHILLEGVRGANKSRGHFRTDQNWIGKPGSPIQNATYIPPHPLDVLECLSDWEKYYHADEKDRLVQLALLHAQFELIHPFLDGNGRMGRLFIPLFLYEKRILSSPTLYVSAYLERTRSEYYARLQAISEDGAWEEWIVYFLKAVTEQALENSRKTKEILDLYNESKEIVANTTRSRYAIQTLDYLFKNPIFTGSSFVLHSHVPKPSAARILKNLQKDGIVQLLREGRGRRPALYMFRRLMNIVA